MNPDLVDLFESILLNNNPADDRKSIFCSFRMYSPNEMMQEIRNQSLVGLQYVRRNLSLALAFARDNDRDHISERLETELNTYLESCLNE